MLTTAVILAAGKSTRMKSDLPKPLHPVCGRAMLGYVLDAAYAAGCDRAVVVVGHGKERVMSAFGDDPRITFVEQTEQRGTGHAVQVCGPVLKEIGGDAVVLAGDLPLLRGESLRQLVERHREEKADLALATATLEDPFGYGRVIRDGRGEFVEIVEQKDATPEQAAVCEVFPSVTCGSISAIFEALEKLDTDNAQGELYFTDVFAHGRAAGRRVLAVDCVSPADIIAPNTRFQLAQAAEEMQRRIQQAHCDAGVGVADPRTVHVEFGAEIGRDTTLMPFTFVGTGARVGDGCTVGPFAHVARGGVVPSGETVAANVGTAGMPASPGA